MLHGSEDFRQLPTAIAQHACIIYDLTLKMILTSAEDLPESSQEKRLNTNVVLPRRFRQ